MIARSIMTDSQGGIHFTAERRYHLFEICDKVHMKRRSIRWSADLRCYVLIVRRDQLDGTLRKILKINDKGGRRKRHI